MKKLSGWLLGAAALSLGLMAPRTANAATTKPVTTVASIEKPASGIVTINYVKGYGIALWNSYQANRHVIANRYLMTGTQWRYSATATVNGQVWYKLGTNQWIQGQYAKVVQQPSVSSPMGKPVTGVATINYAKGYGIAVWDNNTSSRHIIPGKKLMSGTSWRVASVAGINNQTWYNLGGQQWIDGRYVNFKADQPLTDAQFTQRALQDAAKTYHIKSGNLITMGLTTDASGTREVGVYEDQHDGLHVVGFTRYRLTANNALLRYDATKNTWATIQTNVIQ